MALHYDLMQHGTVHGIFDNRAVTTTLGPGIVSVANEHAIVPEGDGIGLEIDIRNAGGEYRNCVRSNSRDLGRRYGGHSEKNHQANSKYAGIAASIRKYRSHGGCLLKDS